MGVTELLIFALIAITFLYLAWVLLRDRVRAKTRRELLERTVAPDRGVGPIAGHQATSSTAPAEDR